MFLLSSPKKARKACFKECKAVMAEVQPLQAAHLWHWKLNHCFMGRQLPLLLHFLPLEDFSLRYFYLAAVFRKHLLRAGKKNAEKASYPVHGDGTALATIPQPAGCPSTGLVMDSGPYRSLLTQSHFEAGDFNPNFSCSANLHQTLQKGPWKGQESRPAQLRFKNQ